MKTKPSSTAGILRKSVPRILLSTFGILIYLLCMPRGITWRNYGTDGAELLAAALTNGVAHPSGYPLYTLLLRGLGILTPENPAFSANVLSAIFITVSGILVFDLIEKQANGISARNQALAAAFLTALMFMFAPLVWAHATVTEVYPLHIFLLSTLIWVSSQTFNYERIVYWDLLIGGLFGLGLANHLTFLFGLPFVLRVFLPEQVTKKEDQPGGVFQYRAKSITRRIGIAGLVAIGLYGSLLLTDPNSPIRWHDPRNFAELIDLMSGVIYQPYLTGPNAFSLSRLLALPGWLVEQVGAFGLFLGLWGLVYATRWSWWDLSLISLALGSIIFSLFFPVYDSFVHLLPFLMVFGLWTGQGLLHLIRLAKGSWSATGLLVVFALNLIYLGGVNWNKVNIAEDIEASAYAERILSSAPLNALLLASEDQTIFPLWYYHDGLGYRSDLRVIAEPLAVTSWYQRNLIRRIPSIVMPAADGADAWRSANPEMIFCEITSAKPPRMSCNE